MTAGSRRPGSRPRRTASPSAPAAKRPSGTDPARQEYRSLEGSPSTYEQGLGSSGEHQKRLVFIPCRCLRLSAVRLLMLPMFCVPPAGFEPVLPPPEAGRTPIMSVSTVSRSRLPCSSPHRVLWCPVVHCTNPCTTTAGHVQSRGIPPLSSTARPPQTVDDWKGVGDEGGARLHDARVPPRLPSGPQLVLIYNISTSPLYSAKSRKSFVLKLASGSSRARQPAAIHDLALIPADKCPDRRAGRPRRPFRHLRRAGVHSPGNRGCSVRAGRIPQCGRLWLPTGRRRRRRQRTWLCRPHKT
jgi:hypothetical protein